MQHLANSFIFPKIRDNVMRDCWCFHVSDLFLVVINVTWVKFLNNPMSRYCFAVTVYFRKVANICAGFCYLWNLHSVHSLIFLFFNLPKICTNVHSSAGNVHTVGFFLMTVGTNNCWSRRCCSCYLLIEFNEWMKLPNTICYVLEGSRWVVSTWW